MNNDWQQGDWLLLDAAGPELVIGIIRDGSWLHHGKHSSGFLESLKPGMAALLEKTNLSLSALNGVIYACGPGSTLGLRLAAMFVRSLLQLPAHRHWTCFSYNNLELACAAQVDMTRKPVEMQLGAPWRKDRQHRVSFHPGPPPAFSLGNTGSEEAVSAGLPFVILGQRASVIPAGVKTVPYPADEIPSILSAWPGLMENVAQPDLYTSETPEFARWSPTPHARK